MSQEKPWFKSYPKGVAREVNINEYRSAAEVFEKSVAKFGVLPAFANMGTTISFIELDRLSRAFGAYLQKKLGLKKGDRIAIQMPNLLQYPVALYGALRAGLVVVNTNPLYTPRELEHQLKDSGAKAIVVLSNFANVLEQVISNTEIETVITTEVGDLLSFPKNHVVNFLLKHVKKVVPETKLKSISFLEILREGDSLKLDAPDLSHEDLAYLQYTGGTTGVSKGAMLTHGNVVANMQQISAVMTPIVSERKEVAITALPLYHIFSLTVNCMSFFKVGALNVLITNPKDLKAFVKELNKYKFSLFTGVNTLFNALLHDEGFRKLDFSHLKIAVGGGMAVQKAVSEAWKELTGSHIVEGYGLTESSPLLSVNPVDGTGRVGTIGLPAPNTDIKILKEDGTDGVMGEVGEICGRGPQIMKGYWKRPDETAKVVIDGWLHTGDIGTELEGGFFKIVDRKKDMILVSGFNVYPNEVEDVIVTHPSVKECAAVGVESEKSGEAVKIFVVKKNPEDTVSAEDIIAHAKKNLAGYKVPKLVEFRDDLPKTNVGKILRRALRDETKKS